nr:MULTISPECIES: transposase family protein [Arthrobacter]
MILDEKQRPVRSWLTVALDDYSRAVAGYALSVQAPTAEHSALAFHQAVSRKHDPVWVVSGLPDVLYSDHGSPRAGLPRTAHPPGPFPRRKAAGTGEDRAFLRDLDHRAPAPPARIHPPRDRRRAPDRACADHLPTGRDAREIHRPRIQRATAF